MLLCFSSATDNSLSMNSYFDSSSHRTSKQTPPKNTSTRPLFCRQVFVNKSFFHILGCVYTADISLSLMTSVELIIRYCFYS